MVILVLVMRYGCRGASDLPPGENSAARLAQIDVMRKRQYAGDVARLVELTSHADAPVSRAAIFALAEFSHAGAAGALTELLGEEHPPRVRAAAAEALGQSGREIDRLILLLKESPDAQVRIGAARGLASWSTPQRHDALPALVAALEDPDREVRKVAVRGIYAASYKRFLFEPDKPPEQQKARIDFIKRRLRELKLLE